MQFYLLMPGDTEQDALNEANLLGESSFGVFWGGQALKTLMSIIDSNPELLVIAKVKTDTNKSLTLEQFLTDIQKLQVRYSR